MDLCSIEISLLFFVRFLFLLILLCLVFSSHEISEMMANNLSLIDCCSTPKSPSLASGAGSPMYLSCDSVDISPRSAQKLVGICRNCSFSYRISRRTTEYFCSKDCQTNFTLFGKFTPGKTPQKTVDEVRTSIYQFQQCLDSEFQQIADDTITCTIVDEEDEDQTVRLELMLPKIDKPKKLKHQQQPKNFFESLFVTTSRRPLRPQLHKFI